MINESIIYVIRKMYFIIIYYQTKECFSLPFAFFIASVVVGPMLTMLALMIDKSSNLKLYKSPLMAEGEVITMKFNSLF